MRICIGNLEFDLFGASSCSCIKNFVSAFGLTTVLAIAGCSGNNGSSAPGQSLAISVANATVRVGDTDQFVIQGKDSGKGEWKVSGAATNGSIDANGLFHAPAMVPKPNSVSIIYTSSGQTLTQTIQILNPTPLVTSVTPNVLHQSINAIAVTGGKFVQGSTVLINNQAVPTTFVDASHLQAIVAAGETSGSQVAISVSNPDPGASSSTSITVQAAIQPMSVSPAMLSGGTVNLSFSNVDFSSDLSATIDGYELSVGSGSGSTVIASGYLPPWHTGSATVRLSSKVTSSTLVEAQIPIAPTAVSFDTASRFLTQAGFGPRPDLVQHIQAVGLDQFITEQQTVAPQPYTPNSSLIDIINRSVLGTTPLRIRMAWALQSFLVRAGISQQATIIPFESKMEADSTGNFRDLMTDVASDVSIAQMLNLAGNAASKDPNVHPNQNFARELLQLFTIGTVMLNEDGTIQIGPDGSPISAYNQDTILDLSRVFTGWNYSRSGNPNYTFYSVDWSAPLIANESQHDNGSKRLFGSVTLPAGQSAEQDRKMALDAIFAHPNLPPFISRILIQRLVKSDPSSEYVKRVVAVFKDNGHGVRGDVAAVTRAILLDPEARSGDTASSPTDGFLQDPYLFETFAMSITGDSNVDGQFIYIPEYLSEPVFYSPTVFGFYSPSYQIPGTTINSPEFQIMNGITIINRSQVLWGIVSGRQRGLKPIPASTWLYQNFKTIPELVEAINHLAYHGQMSKEEQDFIVNYCDQLQTNDPLLSKQSALFLALNDDNYTVAQ